MENWNPEETIGLLEIEVKNMINNMRHSDIFRGFLNGSVDIDGYRRTALRLIANPLNRIEATPELMSRVYNPIPEDLSALNHSAYSEWLVQVSKYMPHNPGFIGKSIRTIGKLAHERPEYKSLIEHLAIDVQEETGHHKWAIDDAFALGVSEKEIKGTRPNQAVRQYLLILEDVVNSDTPLGFEGAAYILTSWAAVRDEGFMYPMTVNLIQKSGIPEIKNAVSVWQNHATLDQEHIQDQTNEILKTPVKYGDHQAMARVAKDIGKVYAEIPEHLPLRTFVRYLKSLRA